eukprot:4984821-Pyramimonas_sp.AAC.1
MQRREEEPRRAAQGNGVQACACGVAVPTSGYLWCVVRWTPLQTIPRSGLMQTMEARARWALRRTTSSIARWAQEKISCLMCIPLVAGRRSGWRCQGQ